MFPLAAKDGNGMQKMARPCKSLKCLENVLKYPNKSQPVSFPRLTPASLLAGRLPPAAPGVSAAPPFPRSVAAAPAAHGRAARGR